MPLPWYSDGLSFECTGCGKCCTGSPGYVWVSLSEMEKIAAHLQIDLSTFQKTYVKKVGNRYSLIEKNKHFDCVFFENNQCTIYPVRPKQCATYPFWNDHLKSKEAWESVSCEGICKKAPKVTFEEIQSRAHDP